MSLQDSLNVWRSACPTSPGPCSLAENENAIEGRTEFVENLLEAGWTPPPVAVVGLELDTQLLGEPWGVLEEIAEPTCE